MNIHNDIRILKEEVNHCRNVLEREHGFLIKLSTNPFVPKNIRDEAFTRLKDVDDIGLGDEDPNRKHNLAKVTNVN